MSPKLGKRPITIKPEGRTVENFKDDRGYSRNLKSISEYLNIDPQLVEVKLI